MHEYEANQVEAVVRECLHKTSGDRKKATQLFGQRVKADAKLRSAVIEPLVDQALSDTTAKTAAKMRSELKDVREPEKNDDSHRVRLIARQQFERQVKRMKLLPFPTRSRKLDLLRELGDLREQVRSSLGTECKLFRVLEEALDSKRLSDIRHALILYEAQPCSMLDRVWGLGPD